MLLGHSESCSSAFCPRKVVKGCRNVLRHDIKAFQTFTTPPLKVMIKMSRNDQSFALECSCVVMKVGRGCGHLLASQCHVCHTCPTIGNRCYLSLWKCACTFKRHRLTPLERPVESLERLYKMLMSTVSISAVPSFRSLEPSPLPRFQQPSSPG